MKFTWSDQKSIILTRAVVAGAIAGCGIMTVSGPWLTRWMVSAHALPPASGPVLLGMGYVCAVLAFVMLVSLYKFLRRIEAGAVFVPANVTALRRISWCCAGAAVVCLAAAYIYLPFAFLGVAAAFMALQVNFICIPPDCVPERFRIAARLSPMVRDACSIPRRISFCKYFLSFFDNFVKSDGNICTAPQNGVS